MFRAANILLDGVEGASRREYVRMDVDNAEEHLNFVSQGLCKTLAGAMLKDVRKYKTALGVLHECIAVATTDLGLGLKAFEFDGKSPLSQKTSAGYEAITRGNVSLSCSIMMTQIRTSCDN